MINLRDIPFTKILPTESGFYVIRDGDYKVIVLLNHYLERNFIRGIGTNQQEIIAETNPYEWSDRIII